MDYVYLPKLEFPEDVEETRSLNDLQESMRFVGTEELEVSAS